MRLFHAQMFEFLCLLALTQFKLFKMQGMQNSLQTGTGTETARAGKKINVFMSLSIGSPKLFDLPSDGAQQYYLSMYDLFP